jgi:hypothetical protein
MDNPYGNITIINSKFTSNTAGSNLINLLYSQMNVTNTTFVDNIASYVNHGVNLVGSTFVGSNITINYT